MPPVGLRPCRSPLDHRLRPAARQETAFANRLRGPFPGRRDADTCRTSDRDRIFGQGTLGGSLGAVCNALPNPSASPAIIRAVSSTEPASGRLPARRRSCRPLTRPGTPGPGPS